MASTPPKIDKAIDKAIGKTPDQPALVQTILSGTSLSSCAFLAIDLQTLFCCPDTGQGTQDTVEVTEKILSITPEFNRLGLKTFWVYYQMGEKSLAESCGGPFKHTIKPADAMNIITSKADDNGFYNREDDLAEKAEQHRLTTLVMGGVSLNACVQRTAIGAAYRGYNVVILSDLCANNIRFKHQTLDQFKYAAKGLSTDNREYRRRYAPAPHLDKKSRPRIGKIAFTESGAFMEHLAAHDAHASAKKHRKAAPR